MGLGFQKSTPGPVSRCLLPVSQDGQDVKLSAAALVTCLSASCHDDGGLTF